MKTLLKWAGLCAVCVLALLLVASPAAAHAAVHGATLVDPQLLGMGVMMTATYAAEHLFSRAEVRMRENDPDADTDCYVDLAQPAAGSAGAPTAGFLSLANFRRFAAQYMTSVGTGGITAFQLVAATSAAGAGAVAVVSHALGSNPNAVGDFVCLECDIEQVREVLPTATHIGVLVNLVTSTDEGICTFTRAEPQFPHAGLTADYVS